MKKIGFLAALCLLLAACGSTSGSAPAAPPSSSAPQLSFSQMQQPPQVDEQKLVQAVDEVLAGYANGSLPRPMAYGTDYQEIIAVPPKGVSLPAQIDPALMEYTQQHNDMYGYYLPQVRYPLQDDNSLVVSVFMAEEGYHATAVHFVDDRGTTMLGTVKAEGAGEFLHFSFSRTYLDASFAGLQLEGTAISPGGIGWEIPSGNIVLSLGEDGTGREYYYFTLKDGELQLQNPERDYLDNGMGMYSYETLMKVAAEVVRQATVQLAAQGIAV